MLYNVKARFDDSKAKNFYLKLTDGTIVSQKEDGFEIVASMERARIVRDGYVCWSETCFCPTPLAHELETVYEDFFTELETELTDKPSIIEGQPFMDYLLEHQTE